MRTTDRKRISGTHCSDFPNSSLNLNSSGERGPSGRGRHMGACQRCFDVLDRGIAIGSRAFAFDRQYVALMASDSDSQFSEIQAADDLTFSDSSRLSAELKHAERRRAESERHAATEAGLREALQTRIQAETQVAVEEFLSRARLTGVPPTTAVPTAPRKFTFKPSKTRGSGRHQPGEWVAVGSAPPTVDVIVLRPYVEGAGDSASENGLALGVEGETYRLEPKCPESTFHGLPPSTLVATPDAKPLAETESGLEKLIQLLARLLAG